MANSSQSQVRDSLWSKSQGWPLSVFLKLYWTTVIFCCCSYSVSGWHTTAWLLWQGLWPTKPKLFTTLPYTLKQADKCLLKSWLIKNSVLWCQEELQFSLTFSSLLCKMMLFSLHIVLLWKSSVIWNSSRALCALRIAVALWLICISGEPRAQKEIVHKKWHQDYPHTPTHTSPCMSIVRVSPSSRLQTSSPSYFLFVSSPKHALLKHLPRTHCVQR